MFQVSASVAAALVFAVASISAADKIIPSITGELSGDLQTLAVPGAPALHWVLKFDRGGEDHRVATFSLKGQGTEVQVAVDVDASGTGTWRITDSRIEFQHWFAGQITRGVAEVSGEGQLKEFVVTGDLTLRLRDADLGEIMKLADPEKRYVRAAKGSVQGTVGIRLRAGKIGAGDSQLGLAPGTVATVSFVPSPGLLTSYVPAQVLKAYPGIRAIEMGETPLEAKVLSLVFRPDGDEEGRGAHVRIEGRPLDPKIIAPLELDVNFTGPLESVVRKALDSRLKVSTK